jgi:hypothetical protein
MSNFESSLISRIVRSVNLKLHDSIFLMTICILGISLLAGVLEGKWLDAILKKQAAILIPLLLVGIILAFVFGRIALLYLLAFCWFIPVNTAGFGFIPITIGITGWELLLWLTMFLALITGDIPLLKPSAPRNGGKSLSIYFTWIGLGIISLFSLLAIGRVVPKGYGEFRYATFDIILLFLVAINLIRNEKQLKFLVYSFLAGCVGMLIFQFGVGGFVFIAGRLRVNFITLTGFNSETLPNHVAILASSITPLVLCLALWNRSGRLVRIFSLIIYGALFAIVFLTVSRAQMITISVASFIVISIMQRHNKKYMIGFVIILSITLILLWDWIFPMVFKISGSEGIANITNRFLSFGDFFAGDQTLGTRINLIRLSLELLQPFGIGYGYIAQLTGYWEHNVFMAILNGSGLFGLLGLILFLSGYAAAAIISWQKDNSFIGVMCVGALASAVTFIINGLSNELIYPTYPESSLVALAIGLAAIKLAQIEK